jgi:hypothetical protein
VKVLHGDCLRVKFRKHPIHRSAVGAAATAMCALTAFRRLARYLGDKMGLDCNIFGIAQVR